VRTRERKTKKVKKDEIKHKDIDRGCHSSSSSNNSIGVDSKLLPVKLSGQFMMTYISGGVMIPGENQKFWSIRGKQCDYPF
jgi:hypothetical protein